MLVLLLCYVVGLTLALPRPQVEVHHTTNPDDELRPATVKRFGFPFFPISPIGPLLTTAAASVQAPGELPAGACKTYAILSARGTSEAQVNPAGSRGLISTVMANVPGGESYEVVYPATFNLLTDPETGAVDLIKHFDAMLNKCPAQKVVLFGYSQGAMVAINAMNSGTIRARAGNVRATIFYGNPYYRTGMPQNRGTAVSGTGIGHLKNIIEGSNAVPAEFVPGVRDYCNTGDPVCQGLLHLRMTEVTVARDGPSFPQHHYEGKQQEIEAIQFVVQQLQS